MRALLTILSLTCLLWTGAAWAQPVGSFVQGPAAAVGYQGPGDVVSGALWWYGLRAYSAAVAATGTQKAVNLVRTSDTHGCDVLIATNGGLGNTANCGTGGDNGQSASAFCNATACHVSIWYDQSGNSRDVSQSSDSVRPVLTFNCVNTSLPCLAFSTQEIVTSATFSQNQPFSFEAVYNTTNITTGLVVAFQGAGGLSSGNSGANLADCSDGVTQNLRATASDGSWHNVNCVLNGGSSATVVDGTATTGNAGSTNVSAKTIAVGGQNNTSLNIAGKIAEGGAWGIGFTSGQYGSLHTNASAYYGTP